MLISGVDLIAVTSPSDVSTLLEINTAGLDLDPMVKWFELYTDRPESEHSREALKKAVEDPNQSLVKAVSRQQDGYETLGFIHWLEVPESDDANLAKDGLEGEPQETKSLLAGKEIQESIHGPQAADNAANPKKERADLARQEHETRIEKGIELLSQGGIMFANIMEGRRHVFLKTMIVHPKYQRKGIARQMIRLVLDEADQKGLPCLLFSRPAGHKLYLNSGFESKGTADISVPELGVPPFHGMLREPRSKR